MKKCNYHTERITNNLKQSRKFYELSRIERINDLVSKNQISFNLADRLTNNENLTDEKLSVFTENVINQFHIPVGLVNGLKVNGKKYLVPIATFEPSVVAALNKATHYVNEADGIQVTGEKLPTIGQIFVTYKKEFADIDNELNEKKEFLINQGNLAVPHLVQRGGGIKNIKFHLHNDICIFEVFVDSKEAMGANLVDTVVERLAPLVAKIVDGEVISSILSNLPDGIPFKAKAQVPLSFLGTDVAKKIVQLSKISSFDIKRSATNNKGVMNGIIGAVIASGNDDRAVSSALYSGHYFDNDQSFTHWEIEQNNLVGRFNGYLPVGTVGGAISIHPDAKNCLELMQVKSSSELARVFMAVGLASNFSALYALVTDGIQKGHMRLQAKSIALSVGITGDDLEEVVNQMILENKFDTLTAIKIKKKMEEKNDWN